MCYNFQWNAESPKFSPCNYLRELQLLDGWHLVSFGHGGYDKSHHELPNFCWNKNFKLSEILQIFRNIKRKNFKTKHSNSSFIHFFQQTKMSVPETANASGFLSQERCPSRKKVAEVFCDLTTSSEVISCLFLQEAESKSTLRRICLTDSKQSSGRRSVNPPTLVCEKMLGISVEKEPKCCNVCRTLQSYEGSNLEIKWRNDWVFGFL